MNSVSLSIFPNLTDNPHCISIQSQKLRHVRKETKNFTEVGDYPDSQHKSIQRDITFWPLFPPIINLSQLISISHRFALKYKEMSVYKENPIQMNPNCDCTLCIIVSINN